jgi:hypothetical protein
MSSSLTLPWGGAAELSIQDVGQKERKQQLTPLREAVAFE